MSSMSKRRRQQQFKDPFADLNQTIREEKSSNFTSSFFGGADAEGGSDVQSNGANSMPKQPIVNQGELMGQLLNQKLMRMESGVAAIQKEELGNLMGGLNNLLLNMVHEEKDLDEDQVEEKRVEREEIVQDRKAEARQQNLPENMAIAKMFGYWMTKMAKIKLNNMGIESLFFFYYYRRSNLAEIYLHGNFLTNIDYLNHYPCLRVVDCSNNFIKEDFFENEKKYPIEIHLPYLRMLDLSNNELTEIPNMHLCRDLLLIALTGNKITHLRNLRPQETPKLQEFYLDKNEIEIKSRDRFRLIVKKLSKLPLVVLDLRGNYFLARNLWKKKLDCYDIKLKVFACTKIREFNGTDRDDYHEKYREAKQSGNKIKDWEEDAESDKSDPNDRHSVEDEEEENDDVEEEEAGPQDRGKRDKKKKQPKALPPNIQTRIPELTEKLNFMTTTQDKEIQQEIATSIEETAEQYDSEKDKIDKYPKYIFVHDNASIKPKEAEEMTEEFLMAVSMVIDIIPDEIVYVSLLRAIAKMSFIDVYDFFGKKCFLCLVDLMKSNEKIENAIEDIVTEDIIERLVKEIHHYPLNLLNNIYDLVSSNEDYTKMLKCLYNEHNDLLPPFQLWLDQIKDSIDEDGKMKEEERVKHQARQAHYDIVMELMSLSVTNDEDNVQRFEDLTLGDEIIVVMKDPDINDRRYLACLQIVANLSNEDEDLADFYIDQRVGRGLVERIGKAMEDITRNEGYLFSHDECLGQVWVTQTDHAGNVKQVDIFERREKYNLLSSQIEALGGLLKSSHAKEDLLDPEDHKKTLDSMMKCLQYEYVDPILLAAVCQFAVDLFEMPLFTQIEDGEARKNSAFYDKWFGYLDDFRQLIPYFGEGVEPKEDAESDEEEPAEKIKINKYKNLLVQTRKYQIASEEEEHAKRYQESGSIQSSNYTHRPQPSESTMDIEGKNQRKNDAIIISLGKLEDPIVFTLYTKILNLLTLFCKNGANAVNRWFDEICEKLNNLGREQALLKALEVQDDKVKLAAVRCFLEIPSDEIDKPEVDGIVMQINKLEAHQIDDGDNEDIVSTLFSIYTKYVCDGYDEDHSKYLQDTHGMVLVNKSFDFLGVTLEREIEAGSEEEDLDKFKLVLAITNFLKACSASNTHLHYALENRHEQFKQCLLNEEMYSSKNAHKWPSDLELTHVGHDISALLATIQGVDVLHSYTIVSMRMFMSIADLLMGFYRNHYVDPNPDESDEEAGSDKSCSHDDKEEEEEDDDDDGDAVQKKLQEFQYDLIRTRKQLERQFWVDPPITRDPSTNQKDWERLNRSHEIYTQSNGISVMIQFLTMRFPENEEMLYYLCDNKFRNQKPTNKPGDLGNLIFDDQAVIDSVQRQLDDLPESFDSCQQYLICYEGHEMEQVAPEDHAADQSDIEVDCEFCGGYVDHKNDHYYHCDKCNVDQCMECAQTIKGEYDELLKINMGKEPYQDHSLADYVEENVHMRDKKFRQKYFGHGRTKLDSDPYHLGQTLENRFNRKNQLVGSKSKKETKDQMANSTYNRDMRNCDFYSFRQHLQFEEDGEDFDDTGNTELSNKELDEQLGDTFRAIINKKEKLERDTTAIEEREEGFINTKFRVLTVAALLRCIYASIQFAPTPQLKFKSIEQLTNITQFRTITQLCDACDWSDEASIGAKYMRIAKILINKSTLVDREEHSKFDFYEVIAAVIDKLMRKIKQKLDQVEFGQAEWGPADKILVYELSQVLFTLVNQTNYFVFSEFDIVRLHRENQLTIMYREYENVLEIKQQEYLMKQMTLVGGSLSEVKSKNIVYDEKTQQLIFNDGNGGGVIKKCELTKNNKSKGFQIDESALVQKRSLNQKVQEFVIKKLIGIDLILNLIETLFTDMAEDHEIFETAKEFALDLRMSHHHHSTSHKDNTFENPNYAHLKSRPTGFMTSEEGSISKACSSAQMDGGQHLFDKESFTEDSSEKSESQQSSEQISYEFVDSEQGLDEHLSNVDSSKSNSKCDSDPHEDCSSQGNHSECSKFCQITNGVKFGQELEEYSDHKSTMSIEKIKDIIGELIATCPNLLQYQIMNSLQRAVIFEQKELRKSFLQEVLDASSTATYRNNLQLYINQNKLQVSNYGVDPKEVNKDWLESDMETKISGQPITRETEFKCFIYTMCSVHINLTIVEELLEVSHYHLEQQIKDIQDQAGKQDLTQEEQKEIKQKINQLQQESKDWEKEHFEKLECKAIEPRLIAITNQGIQVYRQRVKGICSVCKPWDFCPKGPIQEFCIRFSEMINLTICAMVPQRLVLRYRTQNIGKNGEEDGFIVQQLTMHFDKYCDCARFIARYQLVIQEVRLFFSKQIEAEEHRINKYRQIKKHKKQTPIFETTWGPIFNWNLEVIQDKFYHKFIEDRIIEYDLQVIIQQALGQDDQDEWDASKMKDEFFQLQLNGIKRFATDIVTESYLEHYRTPEKCFHGKWDHESLSARTGSKYQKIEDYDYDHVEEPQDKLKTTLGGPVYICHFKNYLFVLKEKPLQWEYLGDLGDPSQKQKFDDYKRNLKTNREKKKLFRESMRDTTDQNQEPQEFQADFYGGSTLQRSFMQRALDMVSGIYDVIICIQLDTEDFDKAVKLRVHSSIIPTVKLLIGTHNHLTLEFNGDMERQLFVSQMWDSYQTRAKQQEEEKSKEFNFSDNPPSDEDQTSEDSTAQAQREELAMSKQAKFQMYD